MDKATRPEKPEPQATEPDRTEEGTLATIHELQSKAGRGLWPLVVFAALSLWAHVGFRYLPDIPPSWRGPLGRPPPVSWISAAFVLYVFSAMILSLTKMVGEGSPGTGFRHVGYLTAFFGFYHVSEGGLGDNFWAVFVGGFAVLTLEWYRNRLFYRTRIREVMEGDRSGKQDE